MITQFQCRWLLLYLLSSISKGITLRVRSYHKLILLKSKSFVNTTHNYLMPVFWVICLTLFLKFHLDKLKVFSNIINHQLISLNWQCSTNSFIGWYLIFLCLWSFPNLEIISASTNSLIFLVMCQILTRNFQIMKKILKNIEIIWNIFRISMRPSIKDSMAAQFSNQFNQSENSGRMKVLWGQIICLIQFLNSGIFVLATSISKM